jgi:hypothetical protein
MILVLILLLGVFSAAWQLTNKASVEPLRRNMTMVVDTYEVESFAQADRLWNGLLQSGVRAAFVRSLDEAAVLPANVQPIAVVNEENWPMWKVSGFQPAGVVFSFNTFPAPLSEVRAVFPTQPFGLLEFTKTSEFAANADQLIGQVWRVYDRAARRTNRFQNEYSISVLERQAELTVVRLLLDDTADSNLQRAAAIHDAIVADGHSIGYLPTPRAAFPQPAWVLWGMALALGAAAGLGIIYLFGSRVPHWLPRLLPPAALAAFFAAQALLDPILLRQLLALASAILYPSVGFLAWWRTATRPDEQRSRFGSVYQQFAVLALFALAGGSSLHAFMARPIFQLNLKQFMGVKFGYLAPLGLAALLVGWYVYQDIRRHPENYLNKRRTRQAIVIVVAAFLGAIFVLLNRSGNATVIPVPTWEMNFRDALFKLLWARPRTKEFLGYPVLLVGLMLWHKRELLYGGLAVLVGYIGILSMVNSFEHLHHPIVLELVRSGIGLTIGMLIGLPALWLANKYAYLLRGHAKP